MNSKNLEQLKEECKEIAMNTAGEYVEKLYCDQHLNPRYVKVIVKNKKGEIGEFTDKEYSLPYTLEDVVLNLNSKASGRLFLGSIDITRENLKSIEIVFD